MIFDVQVGIQVWSVSAVESGQDGLWTFCKKTRLEEHYSKSLFFFQKEEHIFFSDINYCSDTWSWLKIVWLSTRRKYDVVCEDSKAVLLVFNFMIFFKILAIFRRWMEKFKAAWKWGWGISLGSTKKFQKTCSLPRINIEGVWRMNWSAKIFWRKSTTVLVYMVNFVCIIN